MNCSSDLTPTFDIYATMILFWYNVEKEKQDTQNRNVKMIPVGKGAAMAEEILKAGLAVYRSGQNIGLPTIQAYATCISAWAACASQC